MHEVKWRVLLLVFFSMRFVQSFCILGLFSFVLFATEMVINLAIFRVCSHPAVFWSVLEKNEIIVE